MNPPGGGGGGGGGGEPDLRLQSMPSELRFSFTLNGVTHSFEDEPSMKELQSIKRDILRDKAPGSVDEEFIDQVIESDGFVWGIQAGIRASEEYLQSTGESEDR